MAEKKQLRAVDSDEGKGGSEDVGAANAGAQEASPVPAEDGYKTFGEAASSIESFVDDHEEEVSEDGRTVKRRGVYLLPNLFTTGALFCGFYAVVAAMRGDYETAPIAILFALVFDGLDGRVARLTKSSSKFGAEYDSLADMVSFGVAPALVMFSWALGDLGKAGWSAAFMYVACTALRLARFNTQVGIGNPNFFSGLASPAAACILACFVWVCQDQGWTGAAVPYEVGVIGALMTAVVGILMIARVPYHSFKALDLHGRVPFVAMVAIVLLFALVTVDPPKVLLFASVSYAISGPIGQLRRWRRRRSEGAS